MIARRTMNNELQFISSAVQHTAIISETFDSVTFASIYLTIIHPALLVPTKTVTITAESKEANNLLNHKSNSIKAFETRPTLGDDTLSLNTK